MRLTLADGTNIDEVAATPQSLDSVATTETDREHGSITAIAASGSADMATWHDVSELVNDRNWQVAGLQLESGRLDEVFRQITQGDRA